MHLSLDEFCGLITPLKRPLADKALLILWYFDQQDEGAAKSSGELTRIMDDHHVGTANSTRLREQIRETKLAVESQQRFYLKPGSRRVIRAWLPENLEGMQPAMDHGAGYLPEAIWKGTRGYIEEVARQLNGCFKAAYYDAAAVMLRRLLETLIIEAYEHLKREAEIKDNGGNYFMLVELVDRACGDKNHDGINLGRNSKATLKEAREIGNFSAHSRRFLAKASDLTKFQTGVRALAEELIHIANLAPNRW
jgi:hypothetical protein